MKQKYLIAMDLDGTLLTREQKISQATFEFLISLPAEYALTLCTGRPLTSTLQYAQQLGITIPLVVNGGSEILDAAGHEYQYSPMDIGAASKFIGFCRERQLACSLFTRKGVFMLREDPGSLKLHRKYNLVEPRVCAELETQLSSSATRFCLNLPPEDTDSLWQELVTEFADILKCVKATAQIIDIASPEVSKGRALGWVAKHLGVPQQNVIAFGDNHNDLDMIVWAGIGVAMGNAEEAVKAAADFVTKSNHEDGIKLMLAQIIRENRLSKSGPKCIIKS